MRLRRRLRPGAVLGATGAAVVLLTLGGLQLGANLGYDAAAERLADAARLASNAQEDLRQAADALTETSAHGEQIVDGDSGLLVDAATRTALADAVADGEAAASDASDVLGRTVPTAGPKPGWFWDLFAQTAHLEELRLDAEGRQKAAHAEIPDLETAAATVQESGSSMLTVASTAAGPFEAAHVSARNLDMIALRDAADATAAATTLDAEAAEAFVTLDDAAEQVLVSEQAELAEKGGHLQGARLEIEAFARSLAPGVLLDFDWAPIVNGYGGDGSMGGYTTWWYDDPGYATLELSNSIAEQWPAARSKALVAHEVGHAISVKCRGMYDDSTPDSIEKWATAWAIGMGFSDDANGVWAYGYPPQSYIDAAMGCR